MLPAEPQKKKRKPKKRKAPRARRTCAAFRQIDEYAKWCKLYNPRILRVTVALTERYTRTIMGLRAKDPLYWKGLELICIGSLEVQRRRGRMFDYERLLHERRM